MEKYERYYLLAAETLLGVEHAYLKEALISYFNSEMSEKEAYDYLNQMEAVYKQGKDDICSKAISDYDFTVHAENLVCLSTRAAVVKALLSKGRNLYYYYTYYFNEGYFEFDFDTVKLWEQVRFGRVTGSFFHGPYEICIYEIDKYSPEFLRYRKLLYRNTIQQICEKYADFIYVTANQKIQQGMKVHLHYVQSIYQYEY